MYRIATCVKIEPDAEMQKLLILWWQNSWWIKRRCRLLGVDDDDDDDAQTIGRGGSVRPVAPRSIGASDWQCSRQVDRLLVVRC